MTHDLNANTQPLRQRPVFDNWSVVGKGWYVLFPSSQLPKGGVRSAEVGAQRLVVWRGEDGRVRCTDAFCPHMGTDLAIGKVMQNDLRCFFHHWRWSGDGRCVDAPAADRAPRTARLASWATCERYGFVWVWPDATAPGPVPDFPDWPAEETVAVGGVPYERGCHHHVTMINGIDPQHLRTVHRIHIDMDVSVERSEDGRILDISLSGAFPDATLKERVGKRVLGGTYRYSMRYVDGTLGMLSVLQDTRLMGTGPALPSTHMIFAYRPMASRRTFVQPIYVARRRAGVTGRVATRALLTAMKLGFAVLRDEDGAIYENMRFRPANLLPMDAPVARFLSWVDTLPPSEWSTELPSVP